MQRCLGTERIPVEHVVLRLLRRAGAHFPLDPLPAIFAQFGLQLPAQRPFGLAILLNDELAGIAEGMKLANLVRHLWPEGCDGVPQRSLRITHHPTHSHRQGLNRRQQTCEGFGFAGADGRCQDDPPALDFTHQIDRGRALIGLNAIEGEKHAAFRPHLLLPCLILSYLAGTAEKGGRRLDQLADLAPGDRELQVPQTLHQRPRNLIKRAVLSQPQRASQHEHIEAKGKARKSQPIGLNAAIHHL